MSAIETNRFVRFAYNWTPLIVGGITASIIPTWALLIGAKIILPSLAVSGISYFLTAKSGKACALLGAQTAIVMALLAVALPSVVG